MPRSLLVDHVILLVNTVGSITRKPPPELSFTTHKLMGTGHSVGSGAR